MGCSKLKALLIKEKIMWFRFIRKSLFILIFPAIVCVILLILTLASGKKTLHIKSEESITSNSSFFSINTSSNQLFGLNYSLLQGTIKNLGRTQYFGVIDGADLTEKVRSAFEQLNVNYKNFSDVSSFKKYARVPLDQLSDGEVIRCLDAIHITKSQNYSYEYTVYSTQGLYQVHPAYVDAQQRIPRIDYYGEMLNNSGVIFFQVLLGNLLMNNTVDSKTGRIDYGVVPFETEKYTFHTFLMDQIPNLLPMFMGLIFYITMQMNLSRMMLEKFSQIREQMKVMGLSDSIYFLSYLISFGIFNFIQSIPVTLILKFGILPKSDFFIIFFIIFFFGLAFFSYGLFVNSVSSTPRLGMVIGLLLYFVPLVLINAFVNNDYVSFTKKIGTSVFHGNCFTYIVTSLVYVELELGGISFSNIHNMYVNFSIDYGILMLIVDFIIYFILAIYFDNVIPQPGGVAKSPIYFLFPSYWTGGKRQIVDKADSQQSDSVSIFENPSEQLQAQALTNDILTIQNLKKVYSDGKVAVDQISMTLYSGQIFALLGHNGAGKTSTISVLTGFSSSSGGKATAFGYDMFQSLPTVRKFLGYCPQVDILFPNLTVKETLYVMGYLRELPKQQLEEQANNLLDDLKLTESANVLARNLSGGQKRKLCVAIAFMGNNRLVILDEPSSGLDTQARRDMWEILQQYKKDRIIILTTHYMDEADFLGDRIAIMSHGKIKCLGSSLFLKKQFGIGYSLTLVRNKNSNNENELTEFVTSRINDSEFQSISGQEIMFRIPFNSSKQFEGFFSELDKNLEDLQLQSYGISITTLEDVFLRVGLEGEVTSSSKIVPKQPIEEGKLEDDLEANINKTVNTDSKQIAMPLISNQDQNDFSIAEAPNAKFITHLGAMFYRKFIDIKRDLSNFVFSLLLPLVFFFGTFAIMAATMIMPGMTYSIYQLPAPQRIYMNAKLPSSTSNYDIPANFENMNSVLNLTFIDLPESTPISMVKYFDDRIYNASQVEPVEPYRYGSYLLTDVDTSQNVYKILTYFNMTIPQTLISYINVMTEHILKLHSKHDVSIQVNNQQVYGFDPDKNLQDSSSYGLSFNILVPICFSFIPVQICMKTMFEKMTGIKDYNLTSGLSLTAYWICNYIVELITTYIPIIFISIFYPKFTGEIPDGWVLFIVFPLSLVGYSYFFTIIFDGPNAHLFTALFSNVIGVVGNLLLYYLKVYQASFFAGEILTYPFMLFPIVNLVDGLQEILFRIPYNEYRGGSIVNFPKPLDWDAAGKNVAFLVIDFFLYIFIIVISEVTRLKNGRKQAAKIGIPKSTIEIRKEEDVLEEQTRVDTLDASQTAIYASHLFKAYNTQKLAVNDLSFGVSAGELFALLGVNGAGKTTTFKMFTSEIFPSQGSIKIGGLDITAKEFRSNRKMVGYCPQFDCLFPFMTVKEHLVFYSLIKGIPSSHRNNLINYCIDALDLRPFINKPSMKLSGGNKRKLSVALAILGNPPIILLDEPSTGMPQYLTSLGMDPRTRRFMWNVISKISTLWKRSAVILTTHSMEEAEALCTKLGIMVNGSFRCFGSTQHIKNKYGKGFEIETRLQPTTEEEINDAMNHFSFPPNKEFDHEDLRQFLFHTLKKPHFVDEICEEGHAAALHAQLTTNGKVTVQQLMSFVALELRSEALWDEINKKFKKIKILEHYQTYYKVNVEKGSITIGELFGLLEKWVPIFKISEYSVGQTSLEQIFSQFARQGEFELSGLAQAPSIMRKTGASLGSSFERMEIREPGV